MDVHEEAKRVCGPDARVETLDGTREEGGFWRAVVPEPPIGFFRYGKGGPTREVAMERLHAQLRAAPNFDGTPTREAIDRHAKHGGFWYVTRVRIANDERAPSQPAVLNVTVDPHLGFRGYLRATMPRIDNLGGYLDERPWWRMQGATFTALTTDGAPCEACR